MVITVIMGKNRMKLESPAWKGGLQYKPPNLIECTCWFTSLYIDWNFRKRYFLKNIRFVWKYN